MMLSKVYHQNKVSFHCTNLVPWFSKHWFQKKNILPVSASACKYLRQTFQPHFKVISSARAVGANLLASYCSLRNRNPVSRQNKIPTQYTSEIAWHDKTEAWTFYTA